MTGGTFRFAPSPNGRLHLGHAYSALLNASLARCAGGRLLLRIEDIDPTRSRPDFEAGILTDLAWLGVSWDGPVRRQSGHMADYEAAATRLRERGLLYPCVCTRADIARAVSHSERLTGMTALRDPDCSPLYPGTCRALQAERVEARIETGLRPAMRLDTARAVAALGRDVTWTRVGEAGIEETVLARPERWGDPVLVRRDVATSYHLSVVVDDALQGVTDVVRGRDLEAATDIHALLQALLGLPSPRYRHHALLRDDAGAKLSKSLGSRPLKELRDGGTDPSEIRAMVGLP